MIFPTLKQAFPILFNIALTIILSFTILLESFFFLSLILFASFLIPITFIIVLVEFSLIFVILVPVFTNLILVSFETLPFQLTAFFQLQLTFDS